MLADYHIHSEYSDDSTEFMENIILRAIKLGFDEICFTDHVDYGIKTDHHKGYRMTPDDFKKADSNLLNVDYPNYFQKIKELQGKYNGEISIKQGLEFGIQTHTIENYQNLYETYDLDFVILSCHQVNDKEFWNHDFQKGKTADEYNNRYYQEIYDCINHFKNYSVLGHLDMIQRYNESIYPFEQSREIITKILSKVIEDGKGIEINTSSFRYGLKDLMPQRSILRLYLELGGKNITIGSDCHIAQDLGDHIPFVRDELKSLGYTHFCTYEKMNNIHDWPL